MGRTAMWQVDKNELKYTTKWGLMFNFCECGSVSHLNQSTCTKNLSRVRDVHELSLEPVLDRWMAHRIMLNGCGRCVDVHA